MKELQREKIFLVLKNLLIVEVLAYLIFMAMALSADWGEIYEGSILSNYVRFEILEFAFLGLFQLGLIVFVFMRAAKENSIDDLIKAGEHDKLEFKTSLRWDAKLGQVNRELEKVVMKTITAFLNSEGGYLLIGVDDKGNSVGLERDFSSLPKPDQDGFENHFNNLFKTMIGSEFRRFVELSFDNIDGQTVCLVSVEPSQKPVYLKMGENEGFYIRTGNVTTPLKMSETAAYLSVWRRTNK